MAVPVLPAGCALLDQLCLPPLLRRRRTGRQGARAERIRRTHPGRNRMIRVMLADDEAMVRAGVRAILGTDDAIDVVAEAADGVEAVEAVRRHRPDVAVLDIRMPRMAGVARGGGVLY